VQIAIGMAEGSLVMFGVASAPHHCAPRGGWQRSHL